MQEPNGLTGLVRLRGVAQISLHPIKFKLLLFLEGLERLMVMSIIAGFMELRSETGPSADPCPGPNP